MKWLFLLLLANANSYLLCSQSQREYFEQERDLFGVAPHELPFEAHLSHYPTSCINDGGAMVEYPEFTKYMLQSMQYDIKPSVKISASPYLYRVVDWSTTLIWRLLGWRYTMYNEEYYWHYENLQSNNTVFFFHGLNAMNGLENILLLHQFKQNASVYVSLYESTFIFERRNNVYNHTFSQHVQNVRDFISLFHPETLSLVGNSYGTIRIASLCKRMECDTMQRIILTDPLPVNLPYSMAYRMVAFGVFVNGSEIEAHEKRSIVRTMKLDKHYQHALTNLDWYQWTIDSHFMKKHSHNLILVIGEGDYGMSINKTSVAMTTLCRVVYLDAKHGECLLKNVREWI
jgi:hypothetical protein